MIISNGTVSTHTKSKRQMIKLTMKQWKAYPDFDQELMIQTHDIILIDHETKAEKIQRYKKSINWKNYKKFWTKFDKGMKLFDDSLKTFDKEFSKGLGGSPSKKKTTVFPNAKKTTRLTFGNSKRKGKGSNNIDTIFGNKRTKVKVF